MGLGPCLRNRSTLLGKPILSGKKPRAPLIFAINSSAVKTH